MCSSKKIKRTLLIAFVIAMLMGAGPGIYLVNPDPKIPASVTSVFNVPILYLWAVFWFLVQAAVVVIAYLKVWEKSDAN